MRKAVFLAVVGMLGILGNSCVNDIAEIDALFEEGDARVEVGTKIEILYSDSAYVRVRLTAPTLRRHINRADQRDEFPDGVHIDFLDRDGNVESTLDAEKGDRFPRTQKMIVYQNVVLRNKMDEVLETSELVWNERDQTASTTRFVKITKPDEVIYANGFETNSNFSKYQLYAVRGRVKVNDMEKEFKN